VGTENINSEAGLRAAILRLESTQAVEGKILKEQFNLAYESAKPINLIKSTLKEVGGSTEITDSLLNASVGLAAGYASKVLFQGVSHSPLRVLFGTVLQFGITSVVAKNPEVVKSVVSGVYKIISSKVHAANTHNKAQ
jgi:hypothetical protein